MYAEKGSAIITSGAIKSHHQPVKLVYLFLLLYKEYESLGTGNADHFF